MDALSAVAEPSPELTGPGVTFIEREEVSSPAAYRAKYTHPVCPPAPSGIPIGIGYDLRFEDAAKLRGHWDMLPKGVLDRLGEVTGKEGFPQLLAGVSDIEILLPRACSPSTFARLARPTRRGMRCRRLDARR
jgi:hypothetical protein